MNAEKLKSYREKRDFKQTVEPTGEERIDGRQKQQFVIQKHDATTLHYDFRLQIDGVLVSWAVPKGPSTDPAEKRLAVRTEDHPVAYGNFEGVISEGNYGAGSVIIWDRGDFKNLRSDKKKEAVSLEESLDDGKIEVWLEGEKLKGGYVLFRTSNGEDEKWILKKMKDEEADARRNPVNSMPKSVESGKTIDQVANKAESKSK